MKKVPLDSVASKVAAFGIPGLVLVAAMAFTGFAGAAALTTALAALGGPLGMLGGIAALGVMFLISQALTNYGFDALFTAVIRELHKEGLSNADINAKIDSYPISANLKRKLKDALLRTQT